VSRNGQLSPSVATIHHSAGAADQHDLAMRGAGLLLPFWWDTDKLRALTIPPRQMAISELDWHLSWKCWALNGTPFQLTPVEVLHQPRRYRDQADRIANADLRFPIEVTWWEGRWTILDGIHRLARAISMGRRTIQARQLTAADLDHIVDPPPASAAALEAFSDELAAAHA
jgi:hypothetical protein